MISEECLTIEWIKTASAQNSNADKILVEKAIGKTGKVDHPSPG